MNLLRFLTFSALLVMALGQFYQNNQAACNPCNPVQPQQEAYDYPSTQQQPWYQPQNQPQFQNQAYQNPPYQHYSNQQYPNLQYPNQQPYSNQYGNQRFNDPKSPPAGEPGYLPDYRGDEYTNPQRIQDTKALNKPFFDSIGGEPVYPGGVQTNQRYANPSYQQQQNQGVYGRKRRGVFY
ncbi:hypothetical protein L596_024217 [Steinernema carpocapsae]|uniref:Uncharacterized protein n=1 Tax=Steinernema carpocapsae TaxID=34508 RepID=A0A4U5MGC3_STECR|nr:hypothetical protein L596_024217 [Steinernema carpocapsae]